MLVTSSSLSEEGQEQRCKAIIIFQLKQQDTQPETMEALYEVLNLIRDFDFRNNPNGGITSYLRKTEGEGWSLFNTGETPCCETFLSCVSSCVRGFLFGTLRCRYP